MRSSIRPRSSSRSARAAGAESASPSAPRRWTARGRLFSNTGSYISLAAPGSNVFAAESADSDWPRAETPWQSPGYYGWASGTSFAAPLVAGAAALVWAANPGLSAAQVAWILKTTASGNDLELSARLGPPRRRSRGGAGDSRFALGTARAAEAATLLASSAEPSQSACTNWSSWRGLGPRSAPRCEQRCRRRPGVSRRRARHRLEAAWGCR